MINLNVEELAGKDGDGVQKFVDAIVSAQKHGFNSICPRCGKKAVNCADPMYGSLSRRTDIFVCSECGLEEAEEDYYGFDKLPLYEWALFSDEEDE